ncbi:MAG TPA: hypothetical protein VL486_08475 [Verrucomicrobiae bacterium]|nr:hypothetical protein [Verrucomicrobiae bacterium]
MNAARCYDEADYTGCRVLILIGDFDGREGVCVGRSTDGKRRAISPEGTDEVLQLAFRTEFALLVDLSADASKN